MSDQTNGQGVMRLSLNYPALERLLGGDSQLEADLRVNIVKHFTKQHLVPLMETEAMKNAVEALRIASEKAIREQIGATAADWRGKKLQLNPEFEKQLSTKIAQLVEEFMSKQGLFDQIQAYLNSRFAYWTDYADKAVRKHLDVEIERRIKEGINQRLAAAATALAIAPHSSQ